MPSICEFDVAVVGAGPVGAFLANLLGSSGQRIVLLDRESDIYQLPRAVHFDGEVMRAFQAAGLAERVAGIARASSKGMHFVSASGRTLLVRRAYEGVGPNGWARNYYVHQPHLESVLRDGLGRFENVETRLGWEVTAIDQAADRAALTLAGKTGMRTRIEARFVVGCDGARSLVRRLMGSGSEDLGLHQPWLVVDAIVDPGSERVRALKEYTIQLCDPARPMTIVCVGGGRYRWEIMLMPGDDPGSISQPDSVWRLVAPWIGPDDAMLERAALYTFHSLVARGWRKGRLLLAGDACHQTPPFLGQGMCAGIRDAANLAWKLDAVLAGKAGDAVLDTYESERWPHVHAFIGLAVELGAIIQATDPEAARARDESFAGGEPRMFDFPEPQLGPGVRLPGAAPLGQVLPQFALDDGRRLDDVAARGFALLGTPALLSALSESRRAALAASGIRIVDAPSRAAQEWLAGRGVSGVVMRPDGYILATPSSIAELDGALAFLARALDAPASTKGVP